MKCIGTFKFKDLTKREGGSFVNANGERIEYKPCYNLKVDEISVEGINERIFRINVENTQFLNTLSGLKPYDDIKLEFEVKFLKTGVLVAPVALIK